VGAYGDDAGATSAGSVYLYERDESGTWQPAVTGNPVPGHIPNPQAYANDYFGNSVSVSGGLLAVGARWDDAGATNAGSVYLYRGDGGSVAAGVTVISHGFRVGCDSALGDEWPGAMADAICARLAAAAGVAGTYGNVFEYDAASGRWQFLRGSEDLSEELVLLFDWTCEADFNGVLLGPNEHYAEAAGDALFAALLDSRLVDASGAVLTMPDPQDPDGLSVILDGAGEAKRLHFIGHSRGCSVLSETIQRLGTSAIGVDQFTAIDPHPVDGSHCEDVFGDWRDPLPAHWSNIDFLDCYYRFDHDGDPPAIGNQVCNPQCLSLCAGPFCVSLVDTDFDGESLDGIADHSQLLVLGDGLSDSDDGCGVFSSCNMEHVKSHGWYHGTIDTSSVDDGFCAIDGGWYSAARQHQGYSRFAGALPWTGSFRAESGFPTATVDPASEPLATIFNGSFDGNFNPLGSQAGWKFHGGSGTFGAEACIVWQQGRSCARFNLNDDYLVHNRFLLGDNQQAQNIRFLYNITNADTGGCDDEFRLVLIDLEGIEWPLPDEISMCNTSGGWLAHDVSLAGIPRPATYSLRLELVDPGLGFVKSEILIDDIEVIGSQPPAPIDAPQIEVHDVLTGSVLAPGSSLQMGATPQGTPLTRTLAIANAGSGELLLGSLSIPGGYAATAPVGPVPPAEQVTFEVTFEAVSSGTWIGVLAIDNNAVPDPYTLTLVASATTNGGANAPDITVSHAGENLYDGAPPLLVAELPALETWTGMFTIGNVGPGTLGGLSVSLSSGIFEVTLQPTTAGVGSGGSTTFTIEATAPAVGLFQGNVEVASNDPDENPFNFSLLFQAVAPDPPRDLICTTAAGAAQLAWSISGGGFDAIEVVRDGVLIATLSGSATRYIDSAPGVGGHSYGVTALFGGTSLPEASCSVEVLPAAVDALTCQRIPGFNILDWQNTQLYDAIDIRRNGVALASVGGGETSYSDPVSWEGTFTYTVEGIVDGYASAGTECQVTVDLPTMSITAENADGVIGQPGVHRVFGHSPETVLEAFSYGLVCVDSLLTFTDVRIAGTASADADFFSLEIDPAGGWYTVGVVMDLERPLDSTLDLTNESAIAEADFEVSQQAPANITTAITFSGTLGDPPIEVVFVADGASYSPDSADGSVFISAGTPFMRADCNADGTFNIADPVHGLGILFSGSGPPMCADSCDSNDDGLNDIADPIHTLAHLFSNGPAPPAPFPACGIDPTTDDLLDCASYNASCP